MRLRACGAALAVAAAVAAPANAAPIRWEGTPWLWGSPLPSGYPASDVDFTGSRGFVGSVFGPSLRSDDGGTNFVEGAVPFQSVQALDPQTVIGVDRCTAHRSDDGGRTFARLAVGRTPCLSLSVDFIDRSLGFALRDGSVFSTTDGGSTFTLRSALPSARLIDFTTPEVGFGVVGERIMRTTDGGRTWDEAARSPAELTDLDFPTAQVGVAVGEEGAFLRTEDGGNTWSGRPLAGTPRRDHGRVACADPLRCLITGSFPRASLALILTENAGATGRRIGGTSGVTALDFTSDSGVVAVGNAGAILRSADGGRSFSANFARRTAAGPLQTAGRRIISVGSRTLSRSSDGGRSWTPLPLRPPARTSFRDVSFSSSQWGYAATARLGGDADLLRTLNGGRTWRKVANDFSPDLEALLALPGGRVLAAEQTTVMRSSEGGRRFRQVGTGIFGSLSLTGLDRARGLAVAYGPRIVAVSRTGRLWRRLRLPGGTRVAQADFVTARLGFLLDRRGALYRTRNAGRRWTRLDGIGPYAVPGFGSGPSVGIAFAGPQRGYLRVDTGFDSTDPETGAGVDEVSVSYLLRTDDGGDSWRPQFRVEDRPLIDVAVTSRGSAVLSTRGSTFRGPVGDGLLWSDSGGDPLVQTALTLASRPRARRRSGEVLVRGRLTPARPGDRVLLTRRSAGRTDARLVRVSRGGRFASRWQLFRDATFVAQWRSDGRRAGAGTRPLRVRVGRRR